MHVSLKAAALFCFPAFCNTDSHHVYADAPQITSAQNVRQHTNATVDSTEGNLQTAQFGLYVYGNGSSTGLVVDSQNETVSQAF